MKQVVRCKSCQKIIRRAGNFVAELTYADKFFDPKMRVEVFVEEKKKVYLCRKCTYEAGYKVKGMGESQ